MSLSRRTDLVPQAAFEFVKTKEMSLKAMEVHKQDAKSKLIKLQQDLEDLKTSGVKEIELAILLAQAELNQIETHVKRILSSVDTQPQK